MHIFHEASRNLNFESNQIEIILFQVPEILYRLILIGKQEPWDLKNLPLMSGIRLSTSFWKPEWHAALYKVTGNNLYREICKEFMNKHMKVFQREDGLWHRTYDWTTGEHTETARMTRGLGWAMEGLMAMNRMYPDTIYLDYAERMANNLQEYQNDNGSWAFIFNENFEKVGISEKGTALWSLLFYQLYEATGKSDYLKTARKALTWCLENQYTGPDIEAIGGLVGRTPASMVGIRQDFPASCAYTTGFFGMAILEELKIMDQGGNK